MDDNVYAVDGTPADCVNLALVKLLPRRPDLVVSGINRGANLGEDVFYSGTVGGAREGTFFGVPSIAVSLAVRADAEFTPRPPRSPPAWPRSSWRRGCRSARC